MSGLTRTHRAVAGLCRRHARRMAEAGGPTLDVTGDVRAYERRDEYRTVSVTAREEAPLRQLWDRIAPLVPAEMGNARVYPSIEGEADGSLSLRVSVWRNTSRNVGALDAGIRRGGTVDAASRGGKSPRG